jgi:hypothetical protein
MKNYRNLLLSIFSSAVLLLLFFGIGVLWLGGVGQFLAFVNGESLYLSPHLLDLGSHEAGTETVAVFKMTNLTSRDISIAGSSFSCDCALPEGIPISISPGKTVGIEVNVRLPEYDSSYDQTLVFMVAEPSKLSMHPVRITAAILHPLSRSIEESESVPPLMAPQSIDKFT